MARILGGLAYPFQRRTSSRAILLPMSQNASGVRRYSPVR